MPGGLSRWQRAGAGGTGLISADVLRERLLALLARRLRIDVEHIDPTRKLSRYGLDSVEAAVVVHELEDWVGMSLPEDLFAEHASVDAAVAFVIETQRARAARDEA